MILILEHIILKTNRKSMLYLSKNTVTSRERVGYCIWGTTTHTACPIFWDTKKPRTCRTPGCAGKEPAPLNLRLHYTRKLKKHIFGREKPWAWLLIQPQWFCSWNSLLSHGPVVSTTTSNPIAKTIDVWKAGLSAPRLLHPVSAHHNPLETLGWMDGNLWMKEMDYI